VSQQPQRQHGVLTADGVGRWCAVCGHEHGSGYPCPQYDAATLAEIATDSERLFAAMETPGWRARQMANGVPRVVLDIYDAMWGTMSQ